MPTERDALIGADIFDTGIPLSETEPPTQSEGLRSLVQGMIDEALSWRQENLDPELEKATEYYMGEPYGDEVEGRSQVVTTEVRDTVQNVMPSLLRVFLGPERVVEFKPTGPEDAPLAEQATEYINHIVREDNDAFLTFQAAFKDALVRKLGILKWWWEDKTEIVGSEHTGLTGPQLDQLASDDDVVDVDFSQVQDPVIQEVPNMGPVVAQPALFDAVIRREVPDGRAKFTAVPPEEFIFSPSARSKEDARMVGHVRQVPASDLISMGVPAEMVRRHVGESTPIQDESLPQARSIDEDARGHREDEQDPSMRPVQFAELYVMLDMSRYEGDLESADDDESLGVAELRKIQAVGDSAEIFTNEPADEVPFALFPTDPEPHTMVPLSLADKVMDIQRIKSAITRGTLDSLTLTLDPAIEAVEGEVNMKDVLNNEAGKVIRVRRPGMLREITTPFVGKEALPVLDYMDSLKEDRTGVSRAAAGLDADALQSSTRAAVAATVSAAQEQKEMIARIFAETGMTQLFKGLLRLVTRHQERPRTVRLRNEFVQVDPRHWNAGMDVRVNVALGSGLAEEKIQVLSMIAEKQEMLLQQGMPLTDPGRYRSTLKRMVELAGFQDADEFFAPWGPEQQQQWQQMQQAQAQQPSETEALMQVEMAKIQQRKEEAMLDAASKQDKLAQEFALKQAELKKDADFEAAQLELDRADLAGELLKKMSETRFGEASE